MRLPPPSPGTLRVWIADMDRPPVAREALEGVLDAEERARMARFVFPRDRGRFAAARGLLRLVLAEATGIAAARVPLVAGANGRLALHEGPAFNLSHSDARVAIAIATGDPALPLGVDVEWGRPLPELDGVAERVSTPAELARLRALPEEPRLAAFHRLWTRKEACMKATGAGFALSPSTFRVDLDAPVQRVALPPHDFAPAGLELAVHDLPLDGGYAGAVAAAGGPWTVEVRVLPAMPDGA